MADGASEGYASGYPRECRAVLRAGQDWTAELREIVSAVFAEGGRGARRSEEGPAAAPGGGAPSRSRL